MEFTEAMIEELRSSQKQSVYSKYHRRIQAVYFRSQGKTFKEITQLLGYSRDCVRKLVLKYKEFGLSALTTETRGGANRRYLSQEKEIKFLQEELDKAKEGEFVTVKKLHEAYQIKVGKETTRAGFYALLKRHNWRKVSPRPKHPQKADAQVIEASKNKISISGENE